MSARTKLNAIAVTAVLVLSALIGLSANSWLIFVIATILLSVLMIHAGELRLKAGDRSLLPQRRRSYRQ